MLAHFGAPKYPKRFVNPAMWLLTHANQKQQHFVYQLWCVSLG
jgi:hypothetical protein